MDGNNKIQLRLSYLSNVVYLSDCRGATGAKNIADNLAVYCTKRDETGQRVDIGPSAIELLDGAETLLPHLLPEVFGDAWDWAPTKWMPQVSYDRERDVLRLHNSKTSAAWHSMADSLKVGCDEEGRPVCVELTGAAELLLPLMLPLSEEVSPIKQEVNP